MCAWFKHTGKVIVILGGCRYVMGPAMQLFCGVAGWLACFVCILLFVYYVCLNRKCHLILNLFSIYFHGS